MVRGNYVSVFLELSAGLPETSKYLNTCTLFLQFDGSVCVLDVQIFMIEYIPTVHKQTVFSHYN